MFLVASVWFFPPLFKQHYSKGYEQIAIKFYGGVWGGKMKNWLHFGGDFGGE